MTDGKTRPRGRMGSIIAGIAERVHDGLLRPGERLASVRQAARDHGVSKNSMADAYDRLVAMGVLEARQGAGTFVSLATRAPPPRRPPHVAEALDLVSLLREQLDQHHDVRPGDGRPPASWMEGSELAAAFRRARFPGRAEAQYGYGSSWGYLPLRERVGLSLAERAIRCPADQVLLTHGANHALDLVMRHLLEAGDVVLVDDPGYYPLFGKLRLSKVQVVGVRRNPDGPDLADLETKLRELRPKVFFTQSVAHNPTGGSLTLPVAYGVLQATERHGTLIVEDDPFADIAPVTSPRLAALDQLRRVIYVGSYSKTLSASLRVGYVAASPAIVGVLADIKLLTVVATSDHVERFVSGLIDEGHYLRHLRRLRSRIESATASALRELRSLGLEVSAPRDPGYYLWVSLPASSDETALARDAAAQGIFIAPGGMFSPTRTGPYPAMRVHVAHASHPRFLAFMRDTIAGSRSAG